jgi:hypothetical protein
MSIRFEMLRVDSTPLDDVLEDAGVVGSELAYLAKEQRQLPRAWVWRDASSDWPLLTVLIPGSEPLWMLRHPVFTPIVRRWGLALRVIGVSRERMGFDFRALLDDATLRALLGALLDEPRHQPLDLIHETLARSMLQRLPGSNDAFTHLLRRGFVHPPCLRTGDAEFGPPRSLLLKRLQLALRDGQIEVELYSRALRALRQREYQIALRVGALLDASLDPLSLKRGQSHSLRIHWGVYNWLHRNPRHAPARLHLLRRMPWIADWACEHLLQASAPASRLQQSIDTGQESHVLEDLAQVFAVDPNLMRRLWRDASRLPESIDPWQLPRVLGWLNSFPERRWPRDDAQWLEVLEEITALCPP